MGFFFIFKGYFTTRVSPLGISRGIYRGGTQIRVKMSVSWMWLSRCDHSLRWSCGAWYHSS